MKTAGYVVMGVSGIVAFYAMAIYDPSVGSFDGGRVVNLGRMGFQQNLLTVGMGGLIVGAIFVCLGGKKEDHREPPRVAPSPPPVVAADNHADEFAEAIDRQDTATMRRMLDSKLVSAHGRNRHGRGWLQYATVMGAAEAAKVLLAANASPSDVDDFGKSALDEARARGIYVLVELYEPTQNA